MNRDGSRLRGLDRREQPLERGTVLDPDHGAAALLLPWVRRKYGREQFAQAVLALAARVQRIHDLVTSGAAYESACEGKSTMSG